jgi:MOSC N-terminal beta barrel domain
MVNIEELHIYPLKSARGIPKSTVRLAATGLEWDRNWMITDSGGGFLTQRTHPNLARIETDLAATSLTLRAPGLPPLALPLAFEGEVISVQVWKDRCEALDQGPAAGEWARYGSSACQASRSAQRILSTPVRNWRPSPFPMAFQFSCATERRSTISMLECRNRFRWGGFGRILC